MKIIIGITGASGSVLAARAIDYLASHGHEPHVVASANGEKVFAYEMKKPLADFLKCYKYITFHDGADLFSPLASGSNSPDAMIIIPCSMATLGKLASVTGDNLLCRAADCCLKERVPLVICPRESPLTAAHLRNMLALAEMGAVIAPPMPAFYSAPKSVDEIVDGIVGRALKAAGVENEMYARWNSSALFCST